MKKLLLVLCFSISTFVSGQTSSLVIGGVLDLDLPEAGSTGKSLELVAISDIADLSVYAIGVANNGGGTDGLEFDLPAVSLAEGESFWLLRDSAAYHNYFGNVFGDNNVNWVIANPVSQNGDDAIELFLKSANDTTLVDLYGDQNTDGTGEYWEYTDAWAYRNCDSRTPSATFDSTQWTIATPNCSDDSEANATSTCPYPINSCNVVSITFQVDMSNEDVSADGVHIAGSFQGWDPAATALSDADGDGVYSVSVDLTPGDAIEYKYINGNAWGGDEFSGGLPNRSLTIPDEDTVLPAYCFNSLILCSEAYVTFQVDMNFETVSANGVHVAGSFQGWDPAATALSDADADGIYSVTLALTSGDTVEYKYINGNAWGSDETAFGGNRSLVVPSEDTVLPAYCFNSLEECAYEAEGVWVTFRVDMSYEIINEEDGVHIAGSFQGWDPALTVMSDEDDDMVYELMYDILEPAGTTIEYKFVNGNAWGDDEGIAANRSLVVPSEDTVLTVVCFGSFQPCPDPPDSVTVTFVVDMSNEEVSANGVHIAGSMQGWDPAASEMTDADGDGKYEIEFQLATGTSVAYKFVNGNAWGSEETVPDDCVTDGNRTLDVPNFDRPYEVCYGSCEACPAPAVYADVVLTVVDEGNGFEDVEFKGEFSAWDLVQAYDDGTNGDETADDGVWTAVIENVLGPETYEWGAIENDGSEWGIWLLDIIGLPNQEFTVGEDGTVSGSTSMTIPDQGSLITKTVVFSVDMTEWLDEDGATGMPVFSVARGDTMQVRGGFNGWNCDDPTDCVLTRTPGTNIFSLAVAVEGYIENENEYKFYIQHSMESVSVLEEDNGEMYGDMGWEDSPQFGGGNRVFVLGEDDGTGLLELPLAGYYDLPAGAVVPEGQQISAMFTVDMTGASDDGFNAAEDSVYLKLEDKWLKYLQGIDDNYKFPASNNGDGSYSVTVDLTGPVPWHMIYHWEFVDVSEAVTLSEGGGFGFGRFRARYMHANSDDNCSWGDWEFENDVWQKDPPLVVEEWDPDGICIALSVVSDIVPMKFALSDNYPNPFNPTTNISFSIPKQMDVRINIYNIMGQLVTNVTNEQLNAGTYSMQWNGTDQSGNMLPSGLYFYELEAGNEFRQIKKMTLVK